MKQKFCLSLVTLFTLLFVLNTATSETIFINDTLFNFNTQSAIAIKADNELAWYFNLTGGNVSKTNILGIRPRLLNGQAVSSYYIYKSLTQGAKRYYYKDTLDIQKDTWVELHYKKDDRSKSTDALKIEAKFTP